MALVVSITRHTYAGNSKNDATRDKRAPFEVEMRSAASQKNRLRMVSDASSAHAARAA